MPNKPIMYREQKEILDKHMRKLRSEAADLEFRAQNTRSPIEVMKCYDRVQKIVKEMDKISDHLYYLRIAQPI